MGSNRKLKRLLSRGNRIKRVALKIYDGKRFIWNGNYTSQQLVNYFYFGEKYTMIYFKTRNEVRSFAFKSGRKVVDNGASAAPGRRWAIKIV